MKKILSLGLALAMGCFFGQYIEASNQDPLVSLSYLNQRLEELKPQAGAGQSSGLTVVDLKQGQEIIGAQGTELILRAGKARAIISDQGGLSDVTEGRDLKKNEGAKKDHLLLIPRSDGRGLRAQTDAIIMVTGSYNVR